MGEDVTENTRVDVAAVINDGEISRFQYIIFALCILIMMCDGFDTQALAYVVPSKASEWKLSPGSFGPVFAAVLLGSMAGDFAFGYLADRFGRKRTLVLCVILFGVLNVGSAYATSIESFALLRFLCGIGLGGTIPNVMALVSEYAPAKARDACRGHLVRLLTWRDSWGVDQHTADLSFWVEIGIRRRRSTSAMPRPLCLFHATGIDQVPDSGTRQRRRSTVSPQKT
jgi:hypothetical protein